MSFTNCAMALRTCALITLAMLSSYLNAQITLEPGYIIDTTGKRLECKILFKDWLKNPRSIEYILMGEKETRKATTTDILEFGVNDKCLFKSAIVSMDLSSSHPAYAGINRDPEWKLKDLFLKILIEGKATLYYYQDSQIKRFFYSLDNDSIIPLINHAYVEDKGNGRFLLVNESFKQQLRSALNCNNNESTNYENLEYTTQSLIQFFTEYNNCMNSPILRLDNPTKGYFHLGIVGGVSKSSLTAYNSRIFPGYILFDNKTLSAVGLEAEYILPFLRNKWSLVLAPSFEKYESNATAGLYKLSVSYPNIDLPIGLRYSFFIRHCDHRFFAEAWFVPGFILDLNSELSYGSYGKLEIKDGNSYAVGAGMEWNRWSFSCRYYPDIDILRDYSLWYTSYERLSFLLGFRIF